MPDKPETDLLRPRFHFTTQRNWLNDPNGLVWHAGEWHLFYQYNAVGINWGPNSWGHAVSSDLVHWRELSDALDPDERFGWIWSGSAVVDHGNTSGFGDGKEPPLVAMYTTGAPAAGKPCVQGIAFSRDRGRTWIKYDGNPVIAHIVHENRDPKVIWHAPSKRWVMALYLDRNDFGLFASPDLKAWTCIQTVDVANATECPDFFPLNVDGDATQERWVLWTGDGIYRLGTFDGQRFAPTTGPLVCEHGPNGYAAQSWSDAPGGRRVQISWMRGGKYPYMPFNQQMSFPVEMTLVTGPDGIRLHRAPVAEIKSLWGRTQRFADKTLSPTAKLAPEGGSGLYDLELTFAPITAAAGTGVFACRIHGHVLRWRPDSGAVSLLGRDMPAPLVDGTVTLRILVDRTSIEVFANGGRTSASYCFLPEPWDAPLELSAENGECRLVALTVREVSSALAGAPARAGA
ncbi:MAG: glycoside hydrolase family 32 protein [Planctomycetes bacterium]|nr:glycoside hydrolase family 32 protein [Planctomycetota bacterium]